MHWACSFVMRIPLKQSQLRYKCYQIIGTGSTFASRNILKISMLEPFSLSSAPFTRLLASQQNYRSYSIYAYISSSLCFIACLKCWWETPFVDISANLSASASDSPISKLSTGPCFFAVRPTARSSSSPVTCVRPQLIDFAVITT